MQSSHNTHSRAVAHRVGWGRAMTQSQMPLRNKGSPSQGTCTGKMSPLTSVLENQWGLISGRATAAAKSLQSCPTLCDPTDGSPPGSPVPGILQARTLEWVAISFSNAWKGKVKVKSLSCVRLFTTPWTAAHQAPPSMGFSRQEYWSGVPLPSLRESHRAVENQDSSPEVSVQTHAVS